MARTRYSRRSFLASSAVSAAAISVCSVHGAPPPVTNPRATDGDARHEPDWENRLTITVGQDKADLIGRSDRVIQAAVDYVGRLGGGTVKILPGTYTLRNAIHLPSNIRLLGSGADSVLTKIASDRVELSADSDWYDQEITLAEPKDFRVGDGIVLEANDPNNGSKIVIKRTLVAKSGNRFKLDDGLRKNLWISGKPSCASLFPLLTSENTADVLIENLTLDGNRENNENFNGNYGGCIFLQDCNRYTMRGVTTRNYDGDGISFQVCHDIRVENCHSHDNSNLGVHPGSGSQRPVIVNNRLERNNLGLFWCWGVKFGLAENNKMVDNASYGVSIGHNDTDNVMRKNEIRGSGKIGILFRDDARGQDFWANRNVIEQNRIIDNGGDEGIGIDITGRTRDIKIMKNEIIESRNPAKRIGIRLGKDATNVQMSNNSISGFAKSVKDLRA